MQPKYEYEILERVSGESTRRWGNHQFVNPVHIGEILSGIVDMTLVVIKVIHKGNCTLLVTEQKT